METNLKRYVIYNSRVAHLASGYEKYALCGTQFIGYSATEDGKGAKPTCKSCLKSVTKWHSNLTDLLEKDQSITQVTTLKKSKVERSKFDRFLDDLEKLTVEYAEDETIFGSKILTLKQKYKKA